MSISSVRVMDKTVWTDTLFSFKTTRPKGFRFDAGQFARLGIDGTDEPIFRAYSIVSSPYDESLEFFSVVVPDGAFTSKLQHLQVGDKLWLDDTPYGYLTLARYQEPAPHDLWLFATGTGVAPFLSMLQDLDVWQQYRRIVLVYSVRWADELAYTALIDDLPSQFGQLVDNPASLHFVPIVTRESGAVLNKRIPAVLLDGTLEQTLGFKPNAKTSHCMLCGNPAMVDDTKDALKQLGLIMNRRGVGNIAVENYW